MDEMRHAIDELTVSGCDLGATHDQVAHRTTVIKELVLDPSVAAINDDRWCPG